MTPQTTLQISGKLGNYPLAELLIELSQHQLSGSILITRGKVKTVIYLNEGKPVYVVENSRATRLFTILLQRKLIANHDLAAFQNFTGDLELADGLVAKLLIDRKSIDNIMIDQMRKILLDLIMADDGDWVFNPLTRLKDGMDFSFSLESEITAYARTLSHDQAASRFHSLDEVFSLDRSAELPPDIQSHEGFILSRFYDGDLTLDELRQISGLPQPVTFAAVYVLWAIGILTRNNYQSLFTPEFVENARSGLRVAKHAEKVSVRFKEETAPTEQTRSDENSSEPAEASAPKPQIEISLDKYLSQVESSKNHYELLDIDSKADISEIKRVYFALAKMFHPDRFYKEEATKVKRVQDAFTKLSQAYETLKTSESRSTYDFKIRKELAEKKEREAAGIVEPEAEAANNVSMAAESFRVGMEFLEKEEYPQAATNLSRAVHYNNKNAEYHAQLGLALSFIDSQLHKAENSFRKAIDMEPSKPEYRMMLAEFFFDINMHKRAEGELNRLLTVKPGFQEAIALLDTIRNK